MKATFEDFILENPNCSKYRDNVDAQAIFDLLSKDENIIRMIEISELKKPALTPCVALVEDYVRGQSNPLFDVRNEFERTAVGRMVKTILAPFGFRVSGQKPLGKQRGEWFASASCFEQREMGTMRVVKRFEPVE